MARHLFAHYQGNQQKIRRRVREHPFLANLGGVSDQKLRDYLLQRMHTSAAFVAWYQTAYENIRDPHARRVIQGIMDDEEPPNGKPFHVDNLKHDLRKIGVSQRDIEGVEATGTTRRVIEQLHASVRRLNGDPFGDLKIISAVFTAGESMVAPEYEHIARELDRRGLLERRESKFYVPHCTEDGIDGAHTRAFEAVLETMITDDATLDVALRAVDIAAETRFSFFDQFDLVSEKERKGIVNRVALGALVGFAIVVGTFLHLIYAEDDGY